MTSTVVSVSPKPQGRYTTAKRRGDLIFTAGMTPRRGGTLILEGPVRSTDAPELYREAFVLACSNALEAARSLLSGDEAIGEIVAMTVFIAADSAFRAHSQFADYASAYLYDQLGDDGVCVRTAIGVVTLPGGAPVEIQLIVALK